MPLTQHIYAKKQKLLPPNVVTVSANTIQITTTARKIPTINRKKNPKQPTHEHLITHPMIQMYPSHSNPHQSPKTKVINHPFHTDKSLPALLGKMFINFSNTDANEYQKLDFLEQAKYIISKCPWITHQNDY